MGQPQDRQWTVDLRRTDPETGIEWLDRQAGADAFAEAEAIQHREGGTFIIAPFRLQQPPEPGSLTGEPEWVNIGLHFSHKFTPPVRAVEPAAKPEYGPLDKHWEPPAEPEMRDEDEAEAARALEGDEPPAVMPQPTDPADQHTDFDPGAQHPGKLDPADLMPRVG